MYYKWCMTSGVLQVVYYKWCITGGVRQAILLLACSEASHKASCRSKQQTHQAASGAVYMRERERVHDALCTRKRERGEQVRHTPKVHIPSLLQPFAFASAARVPPSLPCDLFGAPASSPPPHPPHHPRLMIAPRQCQPTRPAP